MLKLSIQFDGGHFSDGAFQFARQLSEVTPVSLTGSFLRQSDFVNIWNPAPMGDIPPVIFEDEQAAEAETIARFKAACEASKISYHIHTGVNSIGYPAMKKQTRFSDVFLVGSEVFFNNVSEELPNRYLKDLLHIAECPVIVVPETFQFPSTIVLAYDGTETSVYAIRQFANLFPELSDRKTILAYAGHEDDEIPDLDYIKEFAACHFSNFGFVKVNAGGRKGFNNWLKTIKDPMVISGSFGRNDVFQAVKKSFLTDVIHDHNAVVFIAHK
jgi:hypothetical protein